MKPRLYMIIPCYNEEEAIPIFYREALKVIEQLKDEFELGTFGERRTFHRDLSEPKQRTSKCCSGRNDGSKGCCGHYYFN